MKKLFLVDSETINNNTRHNFQYKTGKMLKQTRKELKKLSKNEDIKKLLKV